LQDTSHEASSLLQYRLLKKESLIVIFFQVQMNIILIRCRGTLKSAEHVGHGLPRLLSM